MKIQQSAEDYLETMLILKEKVSRRRALGVAIIILGVIISRL